MAEPYRKDLRHLSWDEVFARQRLRAGLIDEWMDGLGVGAGTRVLDVGAGPGFVSLALADRVGAAGTVYAMDRSAEALAYLGQRQRERGVSQIERIVADAAMSDANGLAPDSALISMVLHHADDPEGILGNVARLLPATAPAVIAEFHPDGPAEVGPPATERISPEQIRAWSDTAGFRFVSYRRQTQEHYMLVLRRR